MGTPKMLSIHVHRQERHLPRVSRLPASSPAAGSLALLLPLLLLFLLQLASTAAAQPTNASPTLNGTIVPEELSAFAALAQLWPELRSPSGPCGATASVTCTLFPCPDNSTTAPTTGPGVGEVCAGNSTGVFYNTITALALPFSQLSGPIPDALGSLTGLTYLSLRGNSLNGSIPASLCRLSSLLFLDLAHNLLTGGIPPCLPANLTSLWTLDLQGNLLSGELPTDTLGAGTVGSFFPSLRELYLSDNDFSGGIPQPTATDQSGNKALAVLWLNGNKLSGPLPPAMQANVIEGGLLPTTLRSLRFDGNSGISGGLLPGIANLSLLYRLSANATGLNGSIPQCLGNLSVLEVLVLPPVPAQMSCPVDHDCCGGTISMNSSVCDYCYIWCQSCQPCPNCISNAGWAGIWTSVALVAALLLVLLLLWVRGQRRLAQKHDEWEEALKTHAFHRFTWEDIRLATSNFSKRTVIGEGGFGVVYKARGPRGQLWAVKRGKMIARGEEEQKLFETEVSSVSQLSHRNLVRLLGYCNERQEQILVYEFLPNGALSDHLYGDCRRHVLDLLQRLNVAVGAAEGLAYLHHGVTPSIVHRDIKPPNILLDERWQAKVADFGLLKSLTDPGVSMMTRVVGTMGYVDPEYYHAEKVTARSDVYSFGIVLLELLTGRRAYTVMTSTEAEAEDGGDTVGRGKSKVQDAEALNTEGRGGSSSGSGSGTGSGSGGSKKWWKSHKQGQEDVPKGDEKGVHITEWSIPCVDDGDVRPMVDPRILPEGPDADVFHDEVFLPMGRLAAECVARPGRNRPEMAQVVARLKAIRHSTLHMMGIDSGADDPSEVGDSTIMTSPFSNFGTNGTSNGGGSAFLGRDGGSVGGGTYYDSASFANGAPSGVDLQSGAGSGIAYMSGRVEFSGPVAR